MNVPESLLRHLYAYDRALPLGATSEVETPMDPRTQAPRADLRAERITFMSTHDERVMITLTYPTSSGPFPVVITQHGSTPLGRHVLATARPDLPEPVAYRLAAAGMMVASVDAYGFGSREAPDNRGRLATARPDLMFRTRDARMQNVQDLSRTVDYLVTRSDVRADAIGYWGVSMGTRVGIPFLALDRRVSAAALFVGGSGPYSRFVTEGTPYADLAADEAMIAAITDPLDFAPLTSHVTKFVVNGEQDLTVGGREPAERLQRALAEPKEIHWYQGGHGDYGDALIAQAGAFLARHFGVAKA